MKHGVKNRKFGREHNERVALLRSLANALIERERIETTETRAKELRTFIEPLITKGKNDTIAVRRLVRARLGGGQAENTKKLVNELSKKYADRPGGYTRITKIGTQRNDAARRAVIEFV